MAVIFPFSITFSGSIHVVALFLLLNSISLYGHTTCYSTIHQMMEIWVISTFLDIMKMLLYIQVFAWIYVFISVGYITRYEPYDKFYVYHLEELPTCLSRWHFTIPQATYESSNFSPLLSIPVVLIFATLVVSHCGSDLYFLNN